MKKLLFILCLIPLIGNSQSADWKRYQNDSIIELDDNFDPIGFDTNVCPAIYRFDKFVSANFNFGQDSIIITFAGTAIGQKITFRYIITGTDIHVRIEDGLYIPPKREPAEYRYGHIFGAGIIGLIIIILLTYIKRQKNGNINKHTV